MKLTLIFTFAIFAIVGYSQISENFNDGDFTNNPTWSGDDALFTITAGELQSQSAGAATYYLSTPSLTATDAEWNFYFNFSFGTSGSNYCDVFLTSDVADLNNVSNGYFVRIGGTADEISLYKMVSGGETLLIDGVDNLVNSSSNNPFKIRVTRDVSNNWTLLYDDLGSSPSGGFMSAGTVVDNSTSTSGFFGFLIIQSSAASPVNGHYFDSIFVDNIAPDVTAPVIQSVNPTSATTLEVVFDEPVDANTAQSIANYTVDNGVGNPSSATINGSNPSQVDLTFGNSFPQGVQLTLTTTSVEDLSGNALTSSDDIFLYFIPVPAVNGDVLINEIFADPSPQLGLPAAEYVEILNNSTKVFDLAGWVISDGSSNGNLPSYILQPGEVVAIADDAYTTDFSFFPNIIYVTSLPSLNNSSDDLTLTDNNAVLIDQVSYTDDWYGDNDKADGGYSLELINPNLPCSGAANWTASNNPNGGTPGTQNSVYNITPDTETPSIVSANVLSSIEIEICFSEGLDTVGLTAANFSMNNGVTPQFITVSGDLTCVTITCAPALDTGFVYTLILNNISDCSGNVLNSSVSVVLPDNPLAGDLIINEILFNPYTGGDDFVELYNNSDGFINLKDMMLANWDDGVIDNFKPIEEDYLLNPGEFVVITKDSNDIKLNYPMATSGTFLQLSSLPTYSNDSGTVYVLLPDSSISDKFSYDEDLHFALLKDVDGVSLERIDYDRATDDYTNWHSAAESVGWATPGYTNSQYFPGMVTDEMVSVSPDIFSPDNDGFEDVLNLSYQVDESGYVLNITIFDRQGRIERSLVQNELIGAEGSVTWDGLNNNREKSPIGVYIIYFEFFNLDGVLSTVKKSCVVAAKF